MDTKITVLFRTKFKVDIGFPGRILLGGLVPGV